MILHKTFIYRAFKWSLEASLLSVIIKRKPASKSCCSSNGVAAPEEQNVLQNNKTETRYCILEQFLMNVRMQFPSGKRGGDYTSHIQPIEPTICTLLNLQTVLFFFYFSFLFFFFLFFCYITITLEKAHLLIHLPETVHLYKYIFGDGLLSKS